MTFSIRFAITCGLFIGTCCSAAGQTHFFRSGVFLHHSTGGCIWGPNGSTTSVPVEITSYNSSRSFSENSTCSLTEQGWPATPWDNEWYRWHNIFENKDTIDADIRPILKNNKIIIIKSCYPSSNMSGFGAAADTITPTRKSTWNYKWHWRNFIKAMAKHPDNFFVIWTNAPLIGCTNFEGQLSDAFCRWAKDTLALGLDPVCGRFPANVYIFDFFHKLAGTDGKLPLQYAASSGDSHPNADATALVAPQFVHEVFDAAISYESIFSITSVPVKHPETYRLCQNYPNPFNPSTAIAFTVEKQGVVTLKIFDILGREMAILVNEQKIPGTYMVAWNAKEFNSGTYFYRLTVGNTSETKKLVLVK
jgi:hypothetical protein